SYDCYPQWHCGDDVYTALNTAFQHDLMRCVISDKNFLLMESTPSTTNWFPVSKLMRPHMQNTAALQAVAHGSDSVQYFQIHKARGNVEKFHGAVIDHSGKETRVFNDVCTLGGRLRDIKQIQGTKFNSEVAIIFDYENRSALFDSQGPRRSGLDYEGDLMRTYGAFWKMGINTDVIDVTADLSKYKIVAAPMLYMYREGIAEKMREFVKNGGVLIGTYHSGIVDEHDLCYLGELPGDGMNEVFGIWNEEIDALCDNDSNALVLSDGREYEIKRLCAIVHAKSAQVLGTYKYDFYKDTPALTVNEYGKGKAYYIAGGVGADFCDDFYKSLANELGVNRSLNAKLPHGVTAHMRIGDNGEKFIFVENYSGKAVDLPLDSVYYDLNGEQVTALSLKCYDNVILTEKI
ncbi:MAG: beta-galactosidase trimerization domain-containing protein, partial [Acutalibacteraceae bacterium]